MIIGLGLLPLESSALKFKDTPLPSSLTDTPGLESPLPLPLGFLFYFNIFLDFILAILIPHNGIIYIRNAPQKERQKGRSVHNDGLWHLLALAAPLLSTPSVVRMSWRMRAVPLVRPLCTHAARLTLLPQLNPLLALKSRFSIRPSPTVRARHQHHPRQR